MTTIENGQQEEIPQQEEELHPLWLSTETFARVDPELYFERHIRKGLRPNSNRRFMEFRKLLIKEGTISSQRQTDQESTINDNPCFGSCVVRADNGGTSVVCGIVIGTTETANGGGIYPNVEILRGGFNSAPSTEEMTMSQRIFNLIEAMKFSQDNFKVRLQVDSEEDIDRMELEKEDEDPRLKLKELEEEDEGEDLTVNKHKWLVYTAHVQVLSRTGPPFDLVWAAVMGALKDVQIPLFKLDETTNQEYCVKRDTGIRIKFPTGEESIPYSSTFGITNIGTKEDAASALFLGGEDEQPQQQEEGRSVVVLADPDGEIEERCASSRVNIVCDGEGRMTGFSLGIVGDYELRGEDLNHEGLTVGRREIEQMINSAISRSKEIAN